MKDKRRNSKLKHEKTLVQEFGIRNRRRGGKEEEKEKEKEETEKKRGGELSDK